MADQKQIEKQEPDPLTAAARVSEETSSDGKFAEWEVAPKKDERDGDLHLQYRGEPDDR